MNQTEPLPKTTKRRIAVFVIAYDAVNTLAQTIERIPASVLAEVEEIFVIDDCSSDNTFYAALGYKHARHLDKLKVFRNPVNLRYGGNQKRGYQYAIEQGFDIVVMLHADGQYAPEVLDCLLEPLLKEEADMVFGSRMAAGGDPLAGGMPLYKFVGNKILTWLENRILGMNLSEFHSGYRLYNCHALARLPFHLNSNEWHFDTEILIQYKEANFRIAERPIPTYYGDEICHVNGLAYAWNCIKSVLRYRWHKAGWIHVPAFDVAQGVAGPYRLKPDSASSHGVILAEVERLKPRRVLEIGTATGYLSEAFSQRGIAVVGVELDPDMAALARPHCERLIVGDIEALDVATLGHSFDAIVFGDVLEHLKDPWKTLERLTACLAPGGHVIVSLPNVAHWLLRLRLLFGRFDYEPRGPMDQTHLRFFTRKTAISLLRQAGLRLGATRSTPIPLPTIAGFFAAGQPFAWVHTINTWFTHLRPSLLAYQFVLVGQKPTTPTVVPPTTGELRLSISAEVSVKQQV
jgi:glycosyltransferase involved in cell wall biosynthesis/ubiquinone/menaquinone biosynthesis C-methylase UbiE